MAARAGVAKGTLYLYYPSKEELLKAVISQRLSSEIAAVRRVRPRVTKARCADLLRRGAAPTGGASVFDSPTSAVFKLVITEVRNFPEIAEFYRARGGRAGARSSSAASSSAASARGEFRPIDVPAAVLSLVFPMVMLCLHKHSLGACAPAVEMVDPHAFIRQHVQLVLQRPARPMRRPPARSRA